LSSRTGVYLASGYGKPGSLFIGAPGSCSRIGLLGHLRKLTAKRPQSSSSWACYLVFKDRAACSALRLPVSVPIPIGSPSISGAHLLFHASGPVNFRPSASSSSGGTPRRRFVLPISRRGAASTSPPHPASTGFGDSFNHLPPPPHFRPFFVQRRTASRLPSGGDAASTSSPRRVSTDFVDPSFRPARTSVAPVCRGRRAEGVGSLPPRPPLVKSFFDPS
jgi:hypothetical protein